MNLTVLSSIAERSAIREQRIALSVENSWAPYYSFLFDLAGYMQPQYIVEIGVLHGLGTAHFAAGSPRSTVMGLDINFDALCPQFHWKNVIFLQGDPLLMNVRFPVGSGIGILFIDSEHTYETTFAQYQKFLPYMEPGGLILLDDIHQSSSMENVWQSISEPKMEFPNLHGDSGFGATLVS